MTDTQPIRSTLLDEEPELEELVRSFIHTRLPEYSFELRDLVNQRQWECLGELIHQLKGASGAYGYQVLSDFCRQWEIALNNTYYDEMPVMLDHFFGLVNRIRAGHSVG